MRALSWILIFVAMNQAIASDAPSRMQPVIERFAADWASLDRTFTLSGTPRFERMRAFLVAQKKASPQLKSPKNEEAVDAALLSNLIEQRLHRIDHQIAEAKEDAPWIPFEKEVQALAGARRDKVTPGGEASAQALERIRGLVESIDLGKKPPKEFQAHRIARTVERLREAVEAWYKFSDGYDPVFSWWCKDPYQTLNDALVRYAKNLREGPGGLKEGDKTKIIGNAIGRDALLDELRDELIPYSPEELIDMGEREYAWCLAEMKKASAALGYGDDWKRALEHVKQQHVEPGKQPDVIRDLALEAIDFVKKNDLVTVPPLAEETWHMTMMSPEAQLVSPFFLGGETIIVSYPTDTMTHDQKLMSMRGNNRAFARATVHHELIPGHHMQGYMTNRYRPYRELFSTPFWIEGWALYWEMLLWDRNFATTPEEKVGMLYWRMHRCMRIVFSLNFHLGKWTPQQCVDAIVDRVGHERANAEAEVRRSFAGNYGPLYQLAYMVGAFQFRALAQELTGPGKMTLKQYHDAILQNGPMPVAMVRASLIPGASEQWKFPVMTPVVR